MTPAKKQRIAYARRRNANKLNAVEYLNLMKLGLNPNDLHTLQSMAAFLRAFKPLDRPKVVKEHLPQLHKALGGHLTPAYLGLIKQFIHLISKNPHRHAELPPAPDFDYHFSDTPSINEPLRDAYLRFDITNIPPFEQTLEKSYAKKLELFLLTEVILIFKALTKENILAQAKLLLDILKMMDPKDYKANLMGLNFFVTDLQTRLNQTAKVETDIQHYRFISECLLLLPIKERSNTLFNGMVDIVAGTEKEIFTRQNALDFLNQTPEKSRHYAIDVMTLCPRLEWEQMLSKMMILPPESAASYALTFSYVAPGTGNEIQWRL